MPATTRFIYLGVFMEMKTNLEEETLQCAPDSIEVESLPREIIQLSHLQGCNAQFAHWPFPPGISIFR